MAAPQLPVPWLVPLLADRPWALVLALLVAAVVLLVVGLSALAVGRRAQRRSR